MSTDDHQALAEAYTAGFPAGWTLRQHVTHGPEGSYARWTASRGPKPCVWSYLPLVVGLRSTLVDFDLEALRAEAWRQEWLAVVYLVAMALTHTAVRLDGRT